VTCPGQFAEWIERLFVEGITGGNTRGRMAVFLVRAFQLP